MLQAASAKSTETISDSIAVLCLLLLYKQIPMVFSQAFRNSSCNFYIQKVTAFFYNIQGPLCKEVARGQCDGLALLTKSRHHLQSFDPSVLRGVVRPSQYLRLIHITRKDRNVPAGSRFMHTKGIISNLIWRRQVLV